MVLSYTFIVVFIQSLLNNFHVEHFYKFCERD